MNNTLRTTLIVLLVLVLGAGLFIGGMFVASARYWFSGGYGPGGMMGGFGPGNMMGGSRYGNFDRNTPYGPGGMMGGGYGPGGMMGGYFNSPNTNITPLTVDEARTAVEAYLKSYGNDDLAIKEIMTFEYNAYAIVVEKSTGIGAFELLVDPATKAVFPEYGPNMMWNLKYGMHGSAGGGYGMMGGMMGGWNRNNRTTDISAEMPVTAEKAAEIAQEYLDRYQAGATVTEEVTPFYGYYTIDIQQDGSISGMLSVNGYSGQVFPHTWHGDFIEMSEE